MRHTFDIKRYESIDSTNEEIKRLAELGAVEGTVAIANEQTAGKGRQGRSFYSPKNTGIYMSLLLRPEGRPTDALFITTAAAVAVASAIRKVTGEPAGIKWVNDVYIDGKKICGILAEAALDEKVGIKYVVLGIGINVATKDSDFPEEIGGVASSIAEIGSRIRAVSGNTSESTANAAQEFESDAEKLELLKQNIEEAVLDEFMDMYHGVTSDDREGNEFKKRVSEKYRNLSIMIGQPINILENDMKIPAFVDDIDDDCHLLVTLEDGTHRVLTSGEVSTRMR